MSFVTVINWTLAFSHKGHKCDFQNFTVILVLVTSMTVCQKDVNELTSLFYPSCQVQTLYVSYMNMVMFMIIEVTVKYIRRNSRCISRVSVLAIWRLKWVLDT